MDIILQLRPGQVTADRATFDREKGLTSLDCSDPLQVHPLAVAMHPLCHSSSTCAPALLQMAAARSSHMQSKVQSRHAASCRACIAGTGHAPADGWSHKCRGIKQVAERSSACMQGQPPPAEVEQFHQALVNGEQAAILVRTCSN